MEPIISPWYFYLIGTCEGINFICESIFWLSIICALASGVTYLIGTYETLGCLDDEDIKTLNACKKVFLIGIIIAFVFLICFTIIPSAEVAYQMLAASLITPDNLSAVGGSIESIIDYIIEISQQLAP